MGGDRIINFIIGATTVTVVLIVIIAFFDILLTSSVALEPGDPFYPVQNGLVETLADILPWLGVGVIGAAALLISIMREGF